MGGGVMNFDYESEELLSLDESSSSCEHCNDSSDGETLIAKVDNSIRRSRYPIFRLVAKAENLRFEKDMLFLSPKQFKDVMTDYAVHGGWGIKFVKNDLDAVNEKYVVNISAGKASRAREKAQEAVDGAHTTQFNQLWEYCDELRRCNRGSTVMMKVPLYDSDMQVYDYVVYDM
nr:hypothetical protein CFP56_38474 [Quercus suber]